MSARHPQALLCTKSRAEMRMKNAGKNDGSGYFSGNKRGTGALWRNDCPDGKQGIEADFETVPQCL